MTQRWYDYGYIVATIALTVFGQLVLKSRMDHAGPMPSGAGAGLRFLLGLLLDPLVVASFAAAFLAGLSWMAAMTRFELSYAYPFTSLNFVVVLVLGVWLLGESWTPGKVFGVTLIVIGTLFVGASPRAA